MKVSKKERADLKKALTTIRIMAHANDENAETKLLLDNIKNLMTDLCRSLECISDNTENLTREEAIAILRTNPYAKISHELFSKNEFLTGNGCGNVFDENGYLFEDWVSSHANGMRMRTDYLFKNGWYIKKEKVENDNEKN